LLVDVLDARSRLGHQLAELLVVPHCHHRPVKLSEAALSSHSPEIAVSEIRFLYKLRDSQDVVALKRVNVLRIIASIKELHNSRAKIELRHLEDWSAAGNQRIFFRATARFQGCHRKHRVIHCVLIHD